MDAFAIEKVFSMAIKREIEAYEFYRDVANRMQNESVKIIFEQLSKEEMGHREVLEKLKSNPTTMMSFTKPSADYKLAEATELPNLNINMKPADALALAMKKEQQAVESYRKLSSETNDVKIKEIFDNLSNMELQHKNRLENMFTEIGYPEVF